MAGHNRDGEKHLSNAVEGAVVGAVAGAIIGEGVQGAYGPGSRNLQGFPPQAGYQGEGRGQNSLPRLEIDRMHDDSRMAASDLLRSGGRDQRLAQTELQHAALVDREYSQQGRFYQEALRQLSRDVSEQSRNQEKLDMGPGYNGRPDLQIVPNNQPFYEGRRPGTSLPPAPDNYYNNQGPARWKR